MSDIDPLIAGYRRFLDQDWAEERERWTQLAIGQKPKTMLIACSDSRVEPATVFDAAPGELFVVRNVAALVPPFEDGGGRHGVSAALEFAVTQLKVSSIVVLGHGQCGGVSAALNQSFAGTEPGKGGFISHWVDILDEARERVVDTHGGVIDDEIVHLMEEEAVRVSLANLRTFPFVAEAEAAGTLTLTGAWFAIKTGELKLLDNVDSDFRPA